MARALHILVGLLLTACRAEPSEREGPSPYVDEPSGETDSVVAMTETGNVGAPPANVLVVLSDD